MYVILTRIRVGNTTHVCRLRSRVHKRTTYPSWKNSNRDKLEYCSILFRNVALSRWFIVLPFCEQYTPYSYVLVLIQMLSYTNNRLRTENFASKIEKLLQIQKFIIPCKPAVYMLLKEKKRANFECSPLSISEWSKQTNTGGVSIIGEKLLLVWNLIREAFFRYPVSIVHRPLSPDGGYLFPGYSKNFAIL